MYICKYCGKEFENQRAYASHTGKCRSNPNREKSLKHLEYARSCIEGRNGNQKEIYYCQYCGKECFGKNSLVQHEVRCKNNPEKITIVSNFIKYNEDCRNGVKHHPHKGQTKETCESIRKQSETKRIQKENGQYICSFKGRKHTLESKEKMRKSALNYLKNNTEFKCPRYNKKSIDFIDNLNISMGWNLQHAENGGEFEVGGYYIDGYDKNLNIAFEYDEERHYDDVNNSILKKKDLDRQNFIIEILKCDFYRYNEYKKYFYKVN
jgi:hypothetical protein